MPRRQLDSLGYPLHLTKTTRMRALLTRVDHARLRSPMNLRIAVQLPSTRDQDGRILTKVAPVVTNLKTRMKMTTLEMRIPMIWT